MAQIHVYTEKVTIEDTDEFILQETSGGLTKKTLWSDIVTTMGASVNVFGSPGNIAREYIDGSVNAIDTNITLVDTTTIHYEEVDVAITNTNSINVIVSFWHIDGAASAIADEDILLYNVTLEANETKKIIIPGLEVGHSLICKADTIGVNFMIAGREQTAPKVKRLGAITIDGTTNTIDTNIEVVTSAKDYTEIKLFICNRNSTTCALYSIYNIDSDDIADIEDEDVIISDDTILPNELLWDVDFIRDFPDNNMITFSSDIVDVNIIVYGREV